MRTAYVVVLILAGLIPGAALGDRGALTVEVAPALTWWPTMPPAHGSGSGLSGTAAGGSVGIRYGLRNDLDVSASGFYEFPANYTHPGVTLGTDAGAFSGPFSSRTGRWGALLGGRYVTGLVIRYHVGAEVGWARQSFAKLDLINVSDPSNPHTYGLGLRDESRSAFVFAPLAGVEWQVTDHWSVSVMPRVQVMIGGVGRAAVVVPVSVGYSWYGL